MILWSVARTKSQPMAALKVQSPNPDNVAVSQLSEIQSSSNQIRHLMHLLQAAARAGSSRSEYPGPAPRLCWEDIGRHVRSAARFLRQLSRDCRHLEARCQIKTARLAAAERGANRPSAQSPLPVASWPLSAARSAGRLLRQRDCIALLGSAAAAWPLAAQAPQDGVARRGLPF